MLLAIYSKINFEKTYYYSLLIFAFMLPLSKATNSLFMTLFLLLLLLQGNYKHHFELVKSSAFAKSLLFFIGFMTLSLLWTENLDNALSFKKLYWQWFAIFAIALNVKVDQIFTVISAFIAGMVLSEILSYGMFFEFWTIRGHGSAYPSPFMFHITYSLFLGITAIILLNRILSKRYSFKEKLLLLFFFITITGNLFINDGRTGQLAFLVGIFATVFIHYKVTFKSIFGALLLSVFIFGSAYIASNKFQVRVHAAQQDIQKILKGELTSSWGIRVAMYFVTADIVKEHPIIGVGVGDYNSAAKDALEKNDHGFHKSVVAFIPKFHFHNQYLNILVQNGFVGLILMLMIFYNFARLPILNPELKELSLLIIILYLVAFIAEPLWMKQFSNTLFILFSGLFLGASLNAKYTHR